MSIGNFIQGALGGGSVGSAFGPWGTGIGAVVGGVGSLFGGGGGSGSSGGGGGGSSGKTINPMAYLPETPRFVDDYLSDMFGVQKGGFFDRGTQKKFQKAVDSNKLDKYSLMNLYDTAGLDPSSAGYQQALTDTIGKKNAFEIAGLMAPQMYGGGTASRKEIKDMYKLATLTGKTGSPQEFSQFASAYMAQTPEGKKNRMPSGQELLLGSRYGPLVGTESGSFLFGGTPGMDRMFNRQESARRFRADKAKDIFNA
ncbi:MAG: hypothetical protein GY920_09435 [Aliivibrio sp.]|nr:hypothetical protein [Aliivibrio sp.]